MSLLQHVRNDAHMSSRQSQWSATSGPKHSGPHREVQIYFPPDRLYQKVWKSDPRLDPLRDLHPDFTRDRPAFIGTFIIGSAGVR